MTFSPWHQRTEEGKEGKCVRGCFRHWKRKGNAPAIFVLHSLSRKEHSCTDCRTREQARIKVIMDYVSITPKFIGITPMVQHSEMGLWKATGLRFSINSRRKAHCRLSILKAGGLVSATTQGHSRTAGLGKPRSEQALPGEQICQDFDCGLPAFWSRRYTWLSFMPPSLWHSVTAAWISWHGDTDPNVRGPMGQHTERFKPLRIDGLDRFEGRQ